MKLLAFDYGASSGRAILGEFDGSRLTLSELHRFSSDPVMMNGTFTWDFPRLFFDYEIYYSGDLCAEFKSRLNDFEIQFE